MKEFTEEELEILEAFAKYFAESEELDPESHHILYSNLWKLYD